METNGLLTLLAGADNSSMLIDWFASWKFLAKFARNIMNRRPGKLLGTHEVGVW